MIIRFANFYFHPSMLIQVELKYDLTAFSLDPASQTMARAVLLEYHWGCQSTKVFAF